MDSFRSEDALSTNIIADLAAHIPLQSEDTFRRRSTLRIKELEAGKDIIEGDGNHLDILKALVAVDEKMADDVYLKFV